LPRASYWYLSATGETTKKGAFFMTASPIFAGKIYKTMLTKTTPAILFAAACSLLLCFVAAPDAAAQIQIDAVAGQPFGVARVVVPVRGDTVDRKRFAITGDKGRTLYPAFDTHSPGLILSTLLRSKPPKPTAVIAFFLFEGDEPLTLNIETPTTHTITVRPNRGRVAHQRLMRRWWRGYTTAAAMRIEAGEYPPIVETYLTGMLANRLNLPAAQLSAAEEPSPPQQTFELLSGAESLRAAAIRHTMQQRAEPAPASIPLPAAARWLPQAVDPADDPDKPAAIEPIASRVPDNCFYVRFGSFRNYLWVNELMEEFAADTAQLATLRGVDEKLTEKLKRQLALRESEVAKLFGDAVVDDIALIGRDLYFRQGAAIGMLFKTKDAKVFAADLRGQRNYHLKASKAAGAVETQVEIAGRKVSFVSTPDNSIRSYVAVDNNYFLVTTSRSMVEGFFATVDGRRSLAQSASLQLARKSLPLSRGDAVFIHLPPRFLEGLVSPHYQVELARRTQAAAGIEMVHLARLAATAEGRPADSIPALTGGGFLPPWFNTRADGSKFIEAEVTIGEGATDTTPAEAAVINSHRVRCSVRGYRGAFTPVPDMPVEMVTSEELIQVAVRTEYYTRQWRRLDPISIAIKRTAIKPAAAPADGATSSKEPADTEPADTKPGARKPAAGKPAEQPLIERIVIDGNISPIDEKKYGWLLSLLGPPTTEVVAKAPGDVVNFQASLKGGALQPGAAPHLIYAGLQDTQPRIKSPPVNIMDWYRLLKYSPGYLGAWPKPGLLDALPVGLLGVRGEDGFTRYLLGLWRWEGRSHSVLSFDQPTLAATAPHLKLAAPATAPAHIRGDIADLSSSKLADWLNGIYYDRAYRTSLTNVQLMTTLRQQFKVGPQQARRHAEKIYGGEMVCALGGEYTLHDAPTPYWVSTAWNKDSEDKKDNSNTAAGAPGSSPLRWLRKLHFTLIKDGDQVNTHLEADIQRAPKKKPANPLDLLNIFGK